VAVCQRRRGMEWKPKWRFLICRRQGGEVIKSGGSPQERSTYQMEIKILLGGGTKGDAGRGNCRNFGRKLGEPATTERITKYSEPKQQTNEEMRKEHSFTLSNKQAYLIIFSCISLCINEALKHGAQDKVLFVGSPWPLFKGSSIRCRSCFSSQFRLVSMSQPAP
jgi:hypothetical protein